MREKAILLIVLVTAGFIKQLNAQSEVTKWSVKTADSFIKKFPDPDTIHWRNNLNHFDWQAGYFMYTMEKLWKATGDVKYFNYIKRYVDQQVDENGNIPDFKPDALDHFIPGYAIILMYEETGQKKYKKAATKIYNSFKNYPRNQDGSFWHSVRKKGQMWVDGIFMGQIFMARYATVVSRDVSDYNEVTRQMKLGIMHCMKTNGFLLHAWDNEKRARWANRTTGRSPEVWSEGLGWYAILIADVFDFLPKEHPDYHFLMAHLQKLCLGLKLCQDIETGMWFQVVDKPNMEGNWNETSGTGMFMYLIKKSVDKDYIDKEEYADILSKAYSGIITKARKNEEGYIDIIDCSSIGVKKSYQEYISQEKEVNSHAGVSSFILGTMALEYGTLFK